MIIIIIITNVLNTTFPSDCIVEIQVIYYIFCIYIFCIVGEITNLSKVQQIIIIIICIQ